MLRTGYKSSQRQGGQSFFIIVFPEKIRFFEKEDQNSTSSDQQTRVTLTPMVNNQGLAP